MSRLEALTNEQQDSLEGAFQANAARSGQVNNLLAAAMLMLNAWDECGMPSNATRDRMAQALEEFGK